MHPMVEMDLMRAIYRDRIRTAEQHRRVAEVKRRRRLPRFDDDVVIRQAKACDAAELERLAALDSAPTPAGPVLVAEVHGELVAALPLDGAAPVADPFIPSGPLVELLELRARHLRPAA